MRISFLYESDIVIVTLLVDYLLYEDLSSF